MSKQTSSNRGRFAPGPDPRRHALTREERRRGYDHAIQGAGIAFRKWLRSRVAATATQEAVERYKQAFVADRARD